MKKLLNKKLILFLIIILFIVVKTSIKAFALAERTGLINLQGNFKENAYVNRGVEILAKSKGNLYYQINNSGDWQANTAIKNVVLGQRHTLVLLNNNELYGFGLHNYGQVGIGGSGIVGTPTKIEFPEGVYPIKVAGGKRFSMVLTNTGEVYNFGYNGWGQLGLGDKTHRYTPTKVNIENVKDIAAGYNHSLILLENGDLYACGYNGAGEVGIIDGSSPNVYIKVFNAQDVKEISAGENESYILLENGTVYKTGNGTKEFTGVVDLPGKVKKISPGLGHATMLLENGEVYVKGSNNEGQLGTGDNLSRINWTKAEGLPFITDISSTYSGTMLHK